MSHITIEEFSELTKYISENHGFRSRKTNGRMIKYVRCSFDTRFNDIFSVTLDDVVFSTTNENRKRNLKKWLYAYLNREDDGFDPIRDDPEIEWGKLIPELKTRAQGQHTTNGLAAAPVSPAPSQMPNEQIDNSGLALRQA